MIRMLIAIVLGIVLAFGGVAAFDMVSHTIYPPPPGLNFNDPAVLATFVESLPFGAKAIIAAGWFFAPLLGALVAIAIARENLPGWIVATAFLAAATTNLILIPHPHWMVVACFVLPGLAAMLAQLLMSGRVQS
jgi:hypothetical protein